MGDSFIPDSFVPDEDRSRLSAAGTPLPRTLADLAKVPSAPVSLAARSGPDSFVPDSFTPDQDEGPDLHSGPENPVTPPPVRTTTAPKGFWEGLIHAPGERALGAYESLKEAGEPRNSLLARAGHWAGGVGQMISALPPIAYGEYLGGKGLQALGSAVSDPNALTDESLARSVQSATRRGRPEIAVGYQKLLDMPAEDRAAYLQGSQKTVGEFVGGGVGGAATFKALRGAMPARRAVPPQPSPAVDLGTVATESKVPSHIANFDEEVSTLNQRVAALSQKNAKVVTDPVMGDTVSRNVLQDRVAEQMVRVEGLKSEVAATPKTARGGIEQTLEAAKGTTQAPVGNPTLEAVKEFSTGRGPLDLGEVGRRRAAARAAGEAPKPQTEFYNPENTRQGPQISGGSGDIGAVAEPAEQVSRIQRVKNWIAHAKTKAELPNLAGFPPSDVAKGVPAAEKVVNIVQNKQGVVDSLYANLVQEVQDIYKGLSEAQIRQVNRLLDTPSGPDAVSTLGSTEQVTYTRARALFDKLAEAAGIDPGERITAYFPRVREQLGVEKQIIRKIGGKDVPTYVTETTPRRIVKEFFERRRPLDVPADNITLEPVVAYVKGAARRIGFGGGKNPLTGETVTSVLSDIEPHLKGIPPKLADYFAQYVNDTIGIPRGGVSGISAEAAQTIKSLQFSRTIGLNPLSPIINLMQQALTFSEVNPASFARAYLDLRKLRQPTELAKLRQAGVIDVLGPTEHDFLNKVTGKGLPGFSARMANKTGQLFQATEKVNRAHAYFAGLHEAKARGLSGPVAEEFAHEIVRKTQFLFGKEDMPAALRGPLSPHPVPAALQTSMRQFKNFPIKYTMAVKNLIADDVKAVPAFVKALGSGDVMGALNNLPSKTIKFVGATTSLFGSDAITMGLDRTLGGDGRWWQTPGLVGYLGMSLGHQAGLGAIPAEDLNSLLFFLPGPALSMALDAASAGFSLTTGKDVDLSVSGRNTMVKGGPMPPMDPDKTMGQITRSIPLGGITLNRLRNSLIQMRSEDPSMVRKPLTLPQAAGFESVPRTAPIRRPAELAEPVKMALGVQSQRQAETARLRDLLSNATQADNQTAHRAAQLLIGGQPEMAMDLLRRNGVTVTPESLKAAMRAAAIEPALNQALKANRMRRGPAIQEFMKLPAQEP